MLLFGQQITKKEEREMKTKADTMWKRVKKGVDSEVKRRKVTKSDYAAIYKRGELGTKSKARKTKSIFS